MTSFALYMYMDCLDHRDYNLHVHIYMYFEMTYSSLNNPLTELLISDTNFEKVVTEIKEY